MYITLTMKRINYFACATSKIMKESKKNKLSIFKKKNEEKANPLTYFQFCKKDAMKSHTTDI